MKHLYNSSLRSFWSLYYAIYTCICCAAAAALKGAERTLDRRVGKRTEENWRESSEAHVVSRSFGFLTLAPI